MTNNRFPGAHRAIAICATTLACSRAPAPDLVPPSTLEPSFYGMGAYASGSRASARLVHRGRLLASLGPRDFSDYGITPQRVSRLVVPGYDTLNIFVTLRSARGDSLAGVTVTLPLQPQWNYGIGVMVPGPRPLGLCVGRVHAVSLNKPAGPADSMFVTVFGLPEGAVC